MSLISIYSFLKNNHRSGGLGEVTNSRVSNPADRIFFKNKKKCLEDVNPFYGLLAPFLWTSGEIYPRPG